MTTDEIMELQTPSAIRRKGISVLIRELGVVGMVQFIRQFDPGEGDYTKEREALLADLTMDDVDRYLASRKSGN